MKSKLLHEHGEKVYALVFDTGDEATAGLLDFARQNGVTAARFFGLGGFSEVTLGYFDLAMKVYRPIPVREQVEVASLVGNITLHEGEPKVHAHVVVGKRDGTAHAGHLLHGLVRPTLEVMLVQSPGVLERVLDPRYGIPLIGL